MPHGEYHYDTSIRDLLELITSPEQQREYERDVPIADVPAELVCMWFDDLYHPDHEGFRCCFSDQELSALARFNIFYDQRIEALPDSSAGLAALQASPAWQEVMQQARATIEELKELKTGRGY
ncbi:MAG: hypothetical protein GY722_27315 [bacterium]|nr:hypothetical protein [bacterium]